jgi:DNA-binding transcriptional regulator GbsR (MarR family)
LIDKIKSDLYEELTAHYKELYKLPPLASKVFSYFLVDSGQNEYSFDDLVEKFQVSKSSMSSTLHMLSQYDFISQINKIGDRKTYYKITPQHLCIRLKRIKKNLEQEKILTEKLIQLHSKQQEKINPISVEKVNIYTNHLENSIQGLTQTIEKIEKLNHTI